MAEFGIFTTEGLLERSFYSEEQAQGRELELILEPEGYEPDEIWVAELCDEHEGEPARKCDECAAEYDEEPSRMSMWGVWKAIEESAARYANRLREEKAKQLRGEQEDSDQLDESQD
ncbi:hypothetical protein [Nocardia abscessus]|uniref:hypothetical protein n=1 Tax=Nocardia abscessus TaxID=120957 RepID=UPI002456D4B3|nr:hypothetical protein [Nocardia abscessus]